MKGKKILCGLTCAALLAAPGAVLADAPDVNLIVNQAHVYGDESTGYPYVNDQYRTMLPLRIINDTLGYDTEWQKDGQIRITDKDQKVDVTLKIGSTDYIANGEAGKFETAPTTKNNRTYLPARDFSEIYGAIYWEKDSNTVWVSQTDQVDYQMVGKKLMRSDGKAIVEVAVPEGYDVLTDTQSEPIVLERDINGVRYLGLNCGQGFDKPVPLFRENGNALEYVTDVNAGASYYVDGDVVYHTDGMNVGGWQYDIQPKRLSVTTLGENGGTKTYELDFVVNDCTLDMKDGKLIATDPKGVEHVIEGIGR